MPRRKPTAAKGSRSREEVEPHVPQAPQEDEPEEEEEEGGAAAAAQATPTRGRGRGRGRGAVRGAARTPGEEDQPREGPPPPQALAMRERSAPTVLSEAQKEDLMEWIQANECLYNKGNPKYKDSGHKFQLWSVKATELDITPKALMTWWQNQRTKYGRLTRSVGASGSGRKEDSEENKWCRRSFQFLGRFIGRTHSRSGVDLDVRMRQRYPEMAPPETETQTETHAEGDDEDDDEVESIAGETETSATASASTTATGTAAQRKKRKKSKSEESPYVQELQEALNRSAELQAQVAMQMAGGSDSFSTERHQWGAWMSSSMQQIPDSLWPSFMQDSMHLMTDYKARSQALWERSTQQQQVPQQQVSQEQFGGPSQVQQSVEHLAQYSSPSEQDLPAWQHQYQDPTVNPEHVVGMHTRPARPSSAVWGRVPSAILGAPPPSPAPQPCVIMSAPVTQPPVPLQQVTMPELTRSQSAPPVTSSYAPELYTVVDTLPMYAGSNISVTLNTSQFADLDNIIGDK